MPYSAGFKESQLKKILPPVSRSVAEVAKESGVSDQTLRNWLSKANADAKLNIYRIEDTLLTSQECRFWLKLLAPLNILPIDVTFDTSQLEYLLTPDLINISGNLILKDVNSLKKFTTDES